MAAHAVAQTERIMRTRRVQGAPSPTFPEGAWRGVFGEYRALVTDREGSDAYDFYSFAAGVGIRLGRSVHTVYERPLYPNLYIVNVGPTAIARKTTAARRGVSVATEGTEVKHLQSVSSGEGLVQELGDKEDGWGSLTPRRIVITPEEFAGLLLKAKQSKGSTVAPTLTELYDCPEFYSLSTRKNPVKCLRPTVAVIACTTPEWLQAALTDVDMMSGFANRFAYVTGPLRPPNPWPGRRAGAGSIRRALKAMDRRCAGESQCISPDKMARRVWDGWYRDFHNQRWASERVGTMLQRVPERIVKISLLYGAIEGTGRIRADQLEAAIAVGEYEAYCIKDLFSAFADTRQAKLESKVIRIVKEFRGLSFTSLHQRVSGRYSAEELSRVVNSLHRAGVLNLEQVEGKTMILWDGDWEEGE